MRVGQIERQDALVSKASADPPVVATDGGGYKEHGHLSMMLVEVSLFRQLLRKEPLFCTRTHFICCKVERVITVVAEDCLSLCVVFCKP